MSSKPPPAAVARIRYLNAAVIRASWEYYYPQNEKGSCTLLDVEFDSLVWELESMVKLYPRYGVPPCPLLYVDRGASQLAEWRKAHPDAQLGEFRYEPGLYNRATPADDCENDEPDK